MWLGLTIGNSRLHWAWVVGDRLAVAWDTDYLPARVVELACRDTGKLPVEILPPSLIANGNSTKAVESQIPLYIASVVPSQTALWQTYPAAKVITLEQVPLQGIYPTLGIDRALAVLGAGQTLGYPVLAIDCGTALTFTGADAGRLVGGAIIPGLRLQVKSLAQGTAALPEIELPKQMPSRWALNTPGAIQSGVVYAVVAGMADFIEAWKREFPGSRIVLTGGDRARCLVYLQAAFPETASGAIADPHLIFWGMRAAISQDS